MSRVVLSEAARHDRRQITAYTVQRFGLQQARRLRDQFRTALNALADTPFISRANKELDPPGHAFRHYVLMKSFIIIYEPTNDGIRVARLLHGARDLATELDVTREITTAKRLDSTSNTYWVPPAAAEWVLTRSRPVS